MLRFSRVLCSRVLAHSSVSLSVMFALGLTRLVCIRSAQERSAICYNVMTTKTDAETMMMTGNFKFFLQHRNVLKRISLYVVYNFFVVEVQLHWAVVVDIMSAYLFIGRLS